MEWTQPRPTKCATIAITKPFSRPEGTLPTRQRPPPPTHTHTPPPCTTHSRCGGQLHQSDLVGAHHALPCEWSWCRGCRAAHSGAGRPSGRTWWWGRPSLSRGTTPQPALRLCWQWLITSILGTGTVGCEPEGHQRGRMRAVKAVPCPDSHAPHNAWLYWVVGMRCGLLKCGAWGG